MAAGGMGWVKQGSAQIIVKGGNEVNQFTANTCLKTSKLSIKTPKSSIF